MHTFQLHGPKHWASYRQKGPAKLTKNAKYQIEKSIFGQVLGAGPGSL